MLTGALAPKSLNVCISRRLTKKMESDCEHDTPQDFCPTKHTQSKVRYRPTACHDYSGENRRVGSSRIASIGYMLKIISAKRMVE